LISKRPIAAKRWPKSPQDSDHGAGGVAMPRGKGEGGTKIKILQLRILCIFRCLGVFSKADAMLQLTCISNCLQRERAPCNLIAMVYGLVWPIRSSGKSRPEFNTIRLEPNRSETIPSRMPRISSGGGAPARGTINQIDGALVT